MLASNKKESAASFRDIIAGLSEQNVSESKAQLLELANQADQEKLKTTLQILLDFEKSGLELIREHADEIKFIHSAQQDIRRERAQFFANTLKEVSQTLSDAQVPADLSAKWLVELVNSYTKSLSQSATLIESNILELVAMLRAEKNQVVREVVAERDATE